MNYYAHPVAAEEKNTEERPYNYLSPSYKYHIIL